MVLTSTIINIIERKWWFIQISPLSAKNWFAKSTSAETNENHYIDYWLMLKGMRLMSIFNVRSLTYVWIWNIIVKYPASAFACSNIFSFLVTRLMLPCSTNISLLNKVTIMCPVIPSIINWTNQVDGFKIWTNQRVISRVYCTVTSQLKVTRPNIWCGVFSRLLVNLYKTLQYPWLQTSHCAIGVYRVKFKIS